MKTLTDSIFISRPIDEVFGYCTDNQFFDRWMPNVITSIMETPKPMGLGSVLLQDVSFGKKIEQMRGRVTDYETNEKWSYVARGGDFWFRRTFIFESLSKGTKVHYTEESVRSEDAASALAPLAKFFLRKKTEDDNVDMLKGLKRDLESKGTYLPTITE